MFTSHDHTRRSHCAALRAWEYRKYGKLTAIGLLLLCAMLIMPNFVLEFTTRYEMPSTVLDYIGVIIGLFGLILCGLGMTAFRSVTKTLCLDAEQIDIFGCLPMEQKPAVHWLAPVFIRIRSERLVAVVPRGINGCGCQSSSFGVD